MSARRLLLTCLAALAAAPALATAQRGNPPAPSGVCKFDFSPRNPDVFPRVNSVQQPSGAYNSWIGGGAKGYCPDQKITIIADSIEYYGDTKLIYLIGNVHYTEPRVTLDAQRVTYWQLEEHLKAEGQVNTTLPSGTSLNGPVLDYYRPAPRVRPFSHMVAPGRPTIRLVEQDSAGKPTDPAILIANTVVMDADSLVYASGRVELTRPDLVARGDSAFMDNGRGFARLMRKPVVEGKGDRPFTLSGNLIDAYSRERKLEHARSSGDAKAVSEDVTLTADTLDFQLAQSKMQRAFAWGAGRAHAVSPTYDIVADSLDVQMPGQRVREVHALRKAFAQSSPDSTKIRSKEKDWLRGDTVLAYFDTAAADTAGKGGSKPDIKRLLALGNASSLYQLQARDTTADAPAINYIRGRTIALSFDKRQVQSVTVTEKASGLYLEPGVAVAAGNTPNDSAAAAALRAAPGRAGAARPGAVRPGSAQPATRTPATTTKKPPLPTLPTKPPEHR